MTVDELRQMWMQFEEVPINSEDEIEMDFYWWEKGTYRFDLWHWFDEKLPTGIAEYVI